MTVRPNKVRMGSQFHTFILPILWGTQAGGKLNLPHFSSYRKVALKISTFGVLVVDTTFRAVCGTPRCRLPHKTTKTNVLGAN